VAAQDPNCRFCQIIAGDESAHVVFEDANTIAFLDNRPPNGGASGAESNPGGPAPVSSLSNSNIVITPNTLLFPITTAYDPNTNYNLFSVSPNLRPAYTFNFNFNVEKALGSKAITVWIGDGSNFPGQQSLADSLDRYLESAAKIYTALPADWRMQCCTSTRARRRSICAWVWCYRRSR